MDIDKNSYCATHSLSVRSPGWDTRWTDDEIKYANGNDKLVVDHCYSGQEN